LFLWGPTMFPLIPKCSYGFRFLTVPMVFSMFLWVP